MKQKIIHCVSVTFQKVLQLEIWKKKKKKNSIKRTCTFFFDDFNPIDNNGILDIHKYLIKRTWYKIMELIKNIFIGVLTGLVMIQPILLLIYILMNTVKNVATIHLQLNYINVLEVAILLMTCLVKHVFQTKQKI